MACIYNNVWVIKFIGYIYIYIDIMRRLVEWTLKVCNHACFFCGLTISNGMAVYIKLV